jgi:hypothetical protein
MKKYAAPITMTTMATTVIQSSFMIKPPAFCAPVFQGAKIQATLTAVKPAL